MPEVHACIYNQPFIKLDVGTDKRFKKKKEREKETDKGSFSKNHETGIVIMTFKKVIRSYVLLFAFWFPNE